MLEKNLCWHLSRKHIGISRYPSLDISLLIMKTKHFVIISLKLTLYYLQCLDFRLQLQRHGLDKSCKKKISLKSCLGLLFLHMHNGVAGCDLQWCEYALIILPLCMNVLFQITGWVPVRTRCL